MAASGCARCPAATRCLLTGLRFHAAHRNGQDPYGVYGVYGGVWFEPGRPPSRIAVLSEQEARAGHAAYTRLKTGEQEVPEAVAEAERVYARLAAGRRQRRAA